MKLWDYLNVCVDDNITIFDSEYDCECTITDVACEMGRLIDCLDAVCEVVRIKDGNAFINLYDKLGADDERLTEIIHRYFPGVYDQEDFEDGYGYFVMNLFDAICDYDPDAINTYADLFDEVIDLGLLLG